MAWRYDERDHTWWDDDPPVFREVNQRLGYPVPSGPDPAAGVDLVSDFYDDPTRYSGTLDLDALALELRAVRERADPPAVEQTLPFPAPHGDEPDDLFEPLEGHPEGVTMPPHGDEDGIIAMTAGEQDHSNPWTYAGDEADPPANPGAVA